jgi:hypothetical protein
VTYTKFYKYRSLGSEVIGGGGDTCGLTDTLTFQNISKHEFYLLHVFYILFRLLDPFMCPNVSFESRDISVCITLGYGLDDRSSRVRFLAEAGNFFLQHRDQNGSGAHPASYPMGTRGSFLGGKAAGA